MICVKSVGETWCEILWAFGGFSFFLFLLTVYVLVASLYFHKKFCTIYLYVIYSQAFATLTMGLHYVMIGLDSSIFYISQEVGVIVLVTFISYFFVVEIGKITERQSKNKYITIPLLGFNCVYAIGVLVSGIVLAAEGQFVYQCKSWIWLLTASSGIVSGMILIGLALFLKKTLKNWPQYSISSISKSKLAQLWGFATIVLFSYMIMLADSIYKIHRMETCYDYTSNEGANIFLFVLIRLITHYSCIFYSLRVFWPKRVELKHLLSDSHDLDLNSPSLIV